MPWRLIVLLGFLAKNPILWRPSCKIFFMNISNFGIYVLSHPILISQHLNLNMGHLWHMCCMIPTYSCISEPHFQILTLLICLPDCLWLGQCFQDMHCKLQCLPKSTLLKSSQTIHTYLWASYSSHSVWVCSFALVLHVHSRIRYLNALTSCEFFHTYFSILPFDLIYEQTCRLLIEWVLVAEYGEDMVCNFHTSVTSNNAKAIWCYLTVTQSN